MSAFRQCILKIDNRIGAQSGHPTFCKAAVSGLTNRPLDLTLHCSPSWHELRLDTPTPMSDICVALAGIHQETDRCSAYLPKNHCNKSDEP